MWLVHLIKNLIGQFVNKHSLFEYSNKLKYFEFFKRFTSKNIFYSSNINFKNPNHYINPSYLLHDLIIGYLRFCNSHLKFYPKLTFNYKLIPIDLFSILSL